MADIKLYGVLISILLYTYAVDSKAIQTNENKKEIYWGGDDGKMCWYKNEQTWFYAGSRYRLCTSVVCPRNDTGPFINTHCHPCCYGREKMKEKVIERKVINDDRITLSLAAFIIIVVIAVVNFLICIFLAIYIWDLRKKSSSLPRFSTNFAGPVQYTITDSMGNKELGGEQKKDENMKMVETPIVAQDNTYTSTIVTENDDNVTIDESNRLLQRNDVELSSSTILN